MTLPDFGIAFVTFTSVPFTVTFTVDDVPLRFETFIVTADDLFSSRLFGVMLLIAGEGTFM